MLDYPADNRIPDVGPDETGLADIVRRWDDIDADHPLDLGVSGQ
jgi:hypothetical protein